MSDGYCNQHTFPVVSFRRPELPWEANENSSLPPPPQSPPVSPENGPRPCVSGVAGLCSVMEETSLPPIWPGPRSGYLVSDGFVGPPPRSPVASDSDHVPRNPPDEFCDQDSPRSAKDCDKIYEGEIAVKNSFIHIGNLQCGDGPPTNTAPAVLVGGLLQNKVGLEGSFPTAAERRSNVPSSLRLAPPCEDVASQGSSVASSSGEVGHWVSDRGAEHDTAGFRNQMILCALPGDVTVPVRNTFFDNPADCDDSLLSKEELPKPPLQTWSPGFGKGDVESEHLGCVSGDETEAHSTISLNEAGQTPLKNGLCQTSTTVSIKSARKVSTWQTSMVDMCTNVSSAVFMPSVGSKLHPAGCDPCAWFYKPQGCCKGFDCSRCHLCPEGEVKARKKQVKAVKQGMAFKKNATDSIFQRGSWYTQQDFPVEQNALAAGREANREVHPVKIDPHNLNFPTYSNNQPQAVSTRVMENAISPVVQHMDSFDQDTSSDLETQVFRSLEELALDHELQDIYAEKLASHNNGACKPCSYYGYKNNHCRNELDCEFCHFCAKGEAKKRKKAKIAELKKRGEYVKGNRRVA